MTANRLPVRFTGKHPIFGKTKRTRGASDNKIRGTAQTRRSCVELIFTLLLFFAPILSASPPAYSLDIKLMPPNTIILEGRIQSGDYEKFLNAVLENGVPYRTVFLASPGGSAVEAMKIGTLIRRLNYSTEVGSNKTTDDYWCPDRINKENCLCASACPLIFLGGVRRSGDALAVHRIYLNHEALKDLSLKESQSLSSSLSAATGSYLKEMGAPNSLIEMMESAASDKLVRLTKSYVDSNLSGYIKGYDELLIARCGSSEAAFREHLKSPGSVSSLERYRDVINCKSSEIGAEIRRNYFGVINAAIDEADAALIPRESLLSYLKSHRVTDIGDLIGKPSRDAVRFLHLFGISNSYRDNKEITFSDQTINFDGFINALFDDSSVLISLNLRFFKDDNRTPYTGSLFQGLTTNSSPQQFVDALGSPIGSGCYDTKVCVLYFETSRFSLAAYFEPDERTPRFVALHMPNYWRDLLNKGKR